MNYNTANNRTKHKHPCQPAYPVIKRISLAMLLYCLSVLASADEIRPGFLQITETSADIYAVLWKVPAKGNKKLGLVARLPDTCNNKTDAEAVFINGAYIQRWITACTGGMVGNTIAIEGLDSTITDVLLRLELLDGVSHSIVLTPADDRYVIPVQASRLQVAGTYTRLGIGHILMGFDHLLFVFALLLIVKNVRRLIGTITAFTFAHSITLAMATLGLAHVPQRPVEAVIALSILFLAMEIAHEKRGHPGAASRWPWMVAFVFGLLHGFGFAGALAEVGLPQQAIPVALVFFNIGVEIGQLLFIGAVLMIGWMLHKLKQPKFIDWSESMIVYAIGGLSSFWLIERLAAF